MGKKLLKLFENEAKNIKTEKMQKLFAAMLEKCDDLNATEAASSSGKYHPISDLGEEGLYRHSIMVAELAMIMSKSIPMYDTDENKDILYVSALLHDMCKFDSSVDGGSHSLSDHPTRMATMIREYNVENDAEIERVASNIETHMSRWNDIYHFEGKRKVIDGQMPLPKNLENYIMVFADLISANKDLPILMTDLEKAAVNKLVGRG